jgi:nucleotide-binding universal stress UspA family protein
MKFLIPIGAAQDAHAPLDRLERAARNGAPVEAVLLNVQPLFNRHIAQFTRKADRDALRAERSRAATAQAAERLSRAGIPFRVIAEAGEPAERIATVAAREHVDGILTGTGRPHALERYALPAGIAAALLLAAD